MPHQKIQKLINNNEKWANIHGRFLTNFPPSFYPEKIIELIKLCRASKQLRQLIPFISLGRLGLWRYDAHEKECIADDFVCLYFYNGYYVASDWANEEKRFFDTAEAILTFVKQHLNDKILFT